MGLVDSWGGNPIGWIAAHLIEAPVNIIYAVLNPGSWLAWLGHMSMGDRITDQAAAESLIRFIYYGASWELFFALLFIFLVVTAIGIWRNAVLWSCVQGLERFANVVGRIAVWSGLLMVLQQILVIFMQKVFAASQISIGFGSVFTRDPTWWSEILKLNNAAVVCLCVSYTFVQGGHVRVDLVYSAISHRARRVLDMMGSMIFMLPSALVIYFYGWFFLWRSLVTPKFSATDVSKDVDSLLVKARALKWNVETFGSSPNGFDAYFLFKILLVAFSLLVVLHAIAFFYRSYLEFVEGPESEGKYLDKDVLGDPVAETVADIH